LLFKLFAAQDEQVCGVPVIITELGFSKEQKQA
jgi:hypothetical protein